MLLSWSQGNLANRSPQGKFWWLVLCNIREFQTLHTYNLMLPDRTFAGTLSLM